MKRYEPTIEWGETESLGRVTASVRLQESPTGSVVKWEDHEVRRQLYQEGNNALRDERDALKAECSKLNELLGLTRSNNAEEIIGLRECLRAVTADRDRLLLDETHEGVMRERDVLRSAMRIAAPVVRGHNKIHAGDIVRRLNGFTPEQRAACGWPDPEPQKTMTWGEALAALTSGKLVRRQSWAMPDGLESPCGRIRWASILHGWTPDTADFSATDWEICS